jgi:TFIIF-interacting CTD phosphatase-like protein
MYADPIVNALDPQRAVQYRLYRQDTQYVDGKHVRDLSKLNRDMRHVLFISGRGARGGGDGGGSGLWGSWGLWTVGG